MLSFRLIKYISILYSVPLLFLTVVLFLYLKTSKDTIFVSPVLMLSIIIGILIVLILLINRENQSLPKQQRLLTMFSLLTIICSPFGDYIVIPLLGVIICLFCDPIFRSHFFHHSDRCDYLWGSLILWCFIISPFAIENKISSFGMSFALLGYGLLFRIGRYAQFPKQLLQNSVILFSIILMTTVTFALFHMWSQKLIIIGFISLTPHGGPGLASIFSNWPANTAGFLVICTSILCFNIVLPQYLWKERWILILGLVITFFGVLATETRMALLFLLGYGGLFLILYPFELFKKIRFIALLLPLIVLPFLFQHSEKWHRTFTNPLTQATIADRLHQYQYGWELWKANNPILGVGLANFSPSYNTYGDPLIKQLEFSHSDVAFLHNLFLGFFVETGIIGFILLITSIIVLGMKFWKTRKESFFSYFGLYFLTGILFVNMVDSWVYVLRFSLFTFLILGYTLGKAEKSTLL